MKTFNFKGKKKADFEKIITNLKAEEIKDKGSNVLMQIFSGITDRDYLNDLRQFFVDALPKIHLLGTTTAGEIFEGEMIRNSTVISVSIFAKTELKSILIKQEKDNFSLGMNIAQALKTNNTKAYITFGTGLTVNGEEFLKGIEKVSPKIITSGGMAGDNENFKETLIFNAEEITSNGAVAVSLNSDDLIVGNTFNFHWKNIGKKMTVTKAEKNRVYEINDLPVVDVYKKYLGKEVANSLPSVEFPLIIKRSGMTIARDVLNKFDDGSLFLGGNLEVGTKVQFGYGNVGTILKSFKNPFNELKEKPIESIFIYSCTARRIFLGESIVKEIKPLTSIAPVSGFFTYGEFFHINDTNELLNETMTALTLSETSEVPIREDNFEEKLTKREKGHLSTLGVLSHLTQAVTDELVDLNKHLEEKVSQQTKRLRSSYEKLKKLDEAKDNFIAIASHELRTPMTIIQGYASLFLEDSFGELTEEQKTEMKKIFDNTVQLIEMVNDMLDINKLESGKADFKVEAVDISKIARESVEEFKEVICDKKGIKIIFTDNRPSKSLMVLADKEKVIRIFKNLVGNACKFTSNQGRIEVELSLFKEDKNFLQIKVEDNGIGIADDKHEMIFEKFQQVENHLQRDHQGTGLGLSIVRGIIKKLGGKIWLESEVGKGSKFFFILPIANKND